MFSLSKRNRGRCIWQVLYIEVQMNTGIQINDGFFSFVNSLKYLETSQYIIKSTQLINKHDEDA